MKARELLLALSGLLSGTAAQHLQAVQQDTPQTGIVFAERFIVAVSEARLDILQERAAFKGPALIEESSPGRLALDNEEIGVIEVYASSTPASIFVMTASNELTLTTPADVVTVMEVRA